MRRNKLSKTIRFLGSFLSAFLVLSQAPGYSQELVSDGQREITVDGSKRNYFWHMPVNAHGKAFPVILAFHGGGSDSRPGGAGFDRYIDLTQKATAEGFVVVFPNGYKHSWNAGPGPDGKSPNWGPACAENIDDVKFVKMLLNDLDQSVPIDHHRIYATGMSNGSAMAFRLAVDISDQIAAVAGVVSEISLPGPLSLKRPVPMMYFWGTADQIERPGSPPIAERARRNIESLKQLDGCTGRPETSNRGSAKREVYSGKAPVVVWTISGMGHSWPGVTNGPLLRRSLGPDNQDVNASTEIVNFFRGYSIP